MTYLAIDQYGQNHFLRTKYPRKELLERFGRQHADNMYRDDPVKGSNGAQHVGYVIAGRWLTVYRISPLH